MIGIKDFTSALDYFTQAINLPAQAISAIVVSCLKMARFVSLIEFGRPYDIPR